MNFSRLCFVPVIMRSSGFHISLILAFFLLAGAGACAEEFPFSANELMAGVRKNMPLDPLDLSARIRTRNRHGDVRNEQQIDFRLRLGQVPAEAGYTLRSLFGDFRQAVRICLNAQTGIPEIWEQTEEDGEEQPITNPYAPIEKTELNWLDISFGFLWWPGGALTGRETKLGRDAVVLDLPCPDPKAPYSGVRLWVDPEIHAVLEIEAYGENAKRLKRLRVKSLRKREDKWFLKELEVLNVETFRRTDIILQY
jgi:hypothetical protein